MALSEISLPYFSKYDLTRTLSNTNAHVLQGILTFRLELCHASMACRKYQICMYVRV